jgi:hypothetical protein
MPSSVPSLGTRSVRTVQRAREVIGTGAEHTSGGVSLQHCICLLGHSTHSRFASLRCAVCGRNALPE